MTPFGALLRALRAKKNITQADLAKALGVSPAYLSALEHGKKGAPSFLFTQKTIQYFGLIWDEAEALQKAAKLSRPKITIDTEGLSPQATEFVNRLSVLIARLPDEKLERLSAILEEAYEP